MRARAAGEQVEGVVCKRLAGGVSAELIIREAKAIDGQIVKDWAQKMRGVKRPT